MKLHWGNAIFIFFVIFLGLAVTFIIFSLRQNIELEEEDYYKKGADYSRHINIQQRSKIYNDSIIVQELESQVLINTAPSIRNMTDTLKVFFYNPSSKNKDYKVLLAPLLDSLFIDKTKISKGRYILKINWQNSNQEYEVKKDFSIQ